MARVLVCDDDEAIRNVLEIAFEGRHQMDFVEDGEQALGALDQPGKRYDLLLLDVMMPGIDGFEVLRRVRKGSSGHDDLSIIMLTARVTEDDYLRGFRSGADAYVSKPFDPEWLRGLIDEVLARTPEQRKAARHDEQAKAALLRRLERRFG